MDQKIVLVVDDEPLNLHLLRQILKDDYSLRFAKNGREAIENVNKHRPDLVLLDVMMPEMNGYEVCRHLKDDPASTKIPVIFVTAMSDVKDESLGFESGAVDYITKPVSAPTVLARVKTHLSLVGVSELERSHRDALYMLGEAGHFNDTDTGMHIWRMADYSQAIAKQAGWSNEQCTLIGLAASMHDTGKIAIPDTVLKKPDKLSDSEWEIIKTHSLAGYSILSKSGAVVFQLAAEIALYHHERWDGSGYPRHLQAEDIPESARIVAIADVFDALIIERPYKPAWTLEDAIKEIRNNSGTLFDPRLVEVFSRILPELLELKIYWNARESQSPGYIERG